MVELDSCSPVKCNIFNAQATRGTEHPFLSLQASPGTPEAESGTDGVAVSLVQFAKPSNFRYGIAYAKERGCPQAGQVGVAVAGGGGHAHTTNGGVSVGHNYGWASCGAHGVACSMNPGPKGIGGVRGGVGATLVIVWVVGGSMTYSRTIRVGDRYGNGLKIDKDKWYSLNSDWEWECVPENRAPLDCDSQPPQSTDCPPSVT